MVWSLRERLADRGQRRSVFWRQRYIATWRDSATRAVRRADSISSFVTPNSSQTSLVTVERDPLGGRRPEMPSAFSDEHPVDLPVERENAETRFTKPSSSGRSPTSGR